MYLYTYQCVMILFQRAGKEFFVNIHTCFYAIKVDCD
jgi:hypothetical protein